MCNLQIDSYNPTGFNNLTSASKVSLYMNTISNQCDILFLQEHWLLEQQLHKGVTVLPEFVGTAVSGVDETLGRPNSRIRCR